MLLLLSNCSYIFEKLKSIIYFLHRKHYEAMKKTVGFYKFIQIGIFLILFIYGSLLNAQPRERLLMDFNWKFSFGHVWDVEKDFGHGTSYFSYLAKAGYGDGAASATFDDRAWRVLDLPHDWAVEAEFSSLASHSHGYKAIGPGFPESSVGWYRKSFFIPEEDFGKRIFIEFDGVFRDSKVWINGFYCGNEASGYSSFSYDLTEYINFGGDNLIAVRVDASMEEGWFYEGAGIYRHVYLTKTSPLYIPQYGTYITSLVKDSKAELKAQVTVANKYLEAKSFELVNKVIDEQGNIIASGKSETINIDALDHIEHTMKLQIENPSLWDIDHPILYLLETSIYQKGMPVDEYHTNFGIRTIEWTPDRGFFLNGRHVKLKGSNNHQNHAGVGTAIPDALHEWRIKQLKSMGVNTYRMAHYPPSPALLDACDKFGMLVINENRLMGTTDDVTEYLKRLIIRDRNHPAIILWSVGNEEWMIEGNEKGEKIALYMQTLTKKYDDTRPVNIAVSGAWGGGISKVVEVMGYNYLRHGDTDKHHALYPWQASLGTEEGSTNTTRGIYIDDFEKQYLAAYDRPTDGFIPIREGWNHYAPRDYLAGMCIWTGFDYRGEATPFRYPSVVSYFGMMDLCGFPKDNVYYLKSWWTKEPILHIFPHWNSIQNGSEERDVWVYSNFEEVELFLNEKSLGSQTMKANGYLSWMVKYEPGTLKAVGRQNGEIVKTVELHTTKSPYGLAMNSDRLTINADGEDLSVITVRVEDEDGLMIPDAMNEVKFDISGPGKIIGVGNGDPVSHEPCSFMEKINTIKFHNWHEKTANKVQIQELFSDQFDVSDWQEALLGEGQEPGTMVEPTVFRSQFFLEDDDYKFGKIQWNYRSIGEDQSIYINGFLIAENISGKTKQQTFELDTTVLNNGNNVIVILASPFVKPHKWESVNTNPGLLAIKHKAPQWQRRTFNGLAQILVQSTGLAGKIELKAKADGLKEAKLIIDAVQKKRRPYVN